MNKKFLTTLLAILILFAGVSFGETTWDMWAKKNISIKDKEWTITFNNEVSENSLNGNVYIEDSNGSKLDTTVTLKSSDKTKVLVKPNENYKENSTYYLCILKEVCSNANCKLKKSIKMPFIFENANQGEDIIDSEESYITPNVLSSECSTVEYMKVRLRDKNREKITGIKANKIEVVQNGKIIFSTNEIKSYSTDGSYKIKNPVTKLNQFENTNGSNLVDVVLYLHDKEVARIKDYEIKVYSDKIVEYIDLYEMGLDCNKTSVSTNILNVNENDNIEIYATNGNQVITKVDENSYNSYDEIAKCVYADFKLSFPNYSDLKTYEDYYTVVKVNGQEIGFAEESNKRFMIIEDITFNGRCHWSKSISFEGINLKGTGPYTIKAYRDGIIVGESGNLYPQFNEWAYCYVVEVELDALNCDDDEGVSFYLYDSDGYEIMNTYDEELVEDIIE